jgi:DNA-directed RNA polymerase subunit M/transcription elongation factor TFIIS
MIKMNCKKCDSDNISSWTKENIIGENKVYKRFRCNDCMNVWHEWVEMK